MAHFAELDNNNVVKRVIVVSNDDINNLNYPESEEVGINYCKSLFGQDTIWKQTSYNSNFRYNYASVGYTYDDENDAFIPTKSFDSWILDNNFKWKAPIDQPGFEYIWDESQNKWIV